MNATTETSTKNAEPNPVGPLMFSVVAITATTKRPTPRTKERKLSKCFLTAFLLKERGQINKLLTHFNCNIHQDTLSNLPRSELCSTTGV